MSKYEIAALVVSNAALIASIFSIIHSILVAKGKFRMFYKFEFLYDDCGEAFLNLRILNYSNVVFSVYKIEIFAVDSHDKRIEIIIDDFKTLFVNARDTLNEKIKCLLKFDDIYNYKFEVLAYTTNRIKPVNAIEELNA